jgi:hypothetical protein
MKLVLKTKEDAAFVRSHISELCAQLRGRKEYYAIIAANALEEIVVCVAKPCTGTVTIGAEIKPCCLTAPHDPPCLASLGML